MKKRLLLLLSYWIVALVFAFLFGGYGDGSLVPYYVLVSWSGFVTKLLSYLIKFGDSGLFFEGLVVYLSLFILYYVGLIGLVTKLRARGKRGAFLVPGTIHLCGSLAFMIISERQGIFPPGIQDSKTLDWMTLWYLASYFISSAITLFWLYLDWRLAKKSLQDNTDR